MQRTRIAYNNRTYHGYILDSTETLPHFYWFLLEDLELVRTYGDSITFRVEESELVSNRIYCGDDGFIEAVRQVIERYARQRATTCSSSAAEIKAAQSTSTAGKQKRQNGFPGHEQQ